jgi:hypothetical protein
MPLLLQAMKQLAASLMTLLMWGLQQVPCCLGAPGRRSAKNLMLLGQKMVPGAPHQKQLLLLLLLLLLLAAPRRWLNLRKLRRVRPVRRMQQQSLRHQWWLSRMGRRRGRVRMLVKEWCNTARQQLLHRPPRQAVMNSSKLRMQQQGMVTMMKRVWQDWLKRQSRSSSRLGLGRGGRGDQAAAGQ